jgi:hypothetical protein
MKADYEYVYMDERQFFNSRVTYTETIRNFDRFEEKAVGTL